MTKLLHPATLTFPGASNGEFGFPLDIAPVLDRGEGPFVWDDAGRKYLDLSMAWGSVLVGHAHPKIVEAAARQAELGTNFSSVNTQSMRLALRMIEHCPCVERIRFVASGTEATLLCVRIARTYTNRPLIMKFEGAYHGQHPIGVASMVGDDPPELPQPNTRGAGQPSIHSELIVAPYNDLEETTRIFEANADRIASILVEPLHRCITPEPGFLQGLRELTRNHGALLIFDEVVTGFRLALGGAQEYYGVVPDLAAYGKALGGGYPIGAFGGNADVMEVVSEQRYGQADYVWSASTTGGNPVSSAAANAALDLFEEENRYSSLHSLGRFFRSGMDQVLQDSGFESQILGDGPLGQIAFRSSPIRNHQDWLESDRDLGRQLMLSLFAKGLFLNPMGTKLYLSIAHTEENLKEFFEVLGDALKDLDKIGGPER